MNMEIQLPPRIQGQAPTLDERTRRTVIIGANGAGKTRFTDHLASTLGSRAYRMSALKALYDRRDRDESPSSIDSLYANSESTLFTGQHSDDDTTQLERLMMLLMQDEMLNLLSYKLSEHKENGAALKPTRLDKVIEMWQEIFPENKVLIENGHILFSSATTPHDDRSKRSLLRLSAGEKAVLYYIGAALYAPRGGVLFVESPELFLHPTILQEVWNRIETLRQDCTMVYTTHDLEFASSREDAEVIWVRRFSPEQHAWDYDTLPPRQGIPDEVYMAIIGARRPVIFIEGDDTHSIDSKLYPLIFTGYTVKPLGSCNKVIEATRSFNDLKSFHHMDSYGIVDRDRRDRKEVEYLRGKKIMVPEVAEIENILMLEEVIRAVASWRHKNEDRVFAKVKRSVIAMFRTDLHQQALLHTRHRVKRTAEYRIDGRFANIGMLEEHVARLLSEINPRGLYEQYCREFRRYLEKEDYSSILRVYNQKAMLPGSNVAGLCGLSSKEEYVQAVLNILRHDSPEATRIRQAVLRCFSLTNLII